MLVSRIIEIDQEHLDLGMRLHYPLKQGDHTLRRQVLLDIPAVQILVIIRTIGPQDVQTFAAAPHRHLQALAPEQPAVRQRLLPPHRMNAIDEVTTQRRADPTLVPLILLQPLLLLVPLGRAEIPTGFVVRAAQALQQFLGPAVGVGDRERLLDPPPDLFDGSKVTGLDLIVELLLLRFGEFPFVPFVLEGTEGVQAPRAVQFLPVPNGPWGDIEELRHFGLVASLIEPEEGQQAAGDPVITFVVSEVTQVSPLLGVQPETSGRRFHSCLPLERSSETEPVRRLHLLIIGNSRRAAVYQVGGGRFRLTSVRKLKRPPNASPMESTSNERWARSERAS